MSVPHTGTRFLKERLGIDAYYHVWLKWPDVMRRAWGASKVYVPLRHPEDVYKSWIKRERLGDKSGPWRWYMAWYTLQALDDRLDLDVICVDKQEDPRIKDWERVGFREPPAKQTHFHDVRWDVLFQLPIVSRHYEL